MLFKATPSIAGLVTTVAALAFVGCSEDVQTGPELQSSADLLPNGPLTDPSLGFEGTKLCKYGSAADFTVSGASGSFGVHLEDGECRFIALNEQNASFDVTVTEVSAPAGFALDHIEVLSAGGVDIVTGTSTVTRTIKPTYVFSYYNRALLDGRMTGGGGQIRFDGVRITRGLTLHCDIDLSNNLEVNWPGGNRWHLTKPITSATCVDDPAISPLPPEAPFDTFIGEGFGSLNGVAGSFVRFTFVDAGEPGRNDSASIEIWAPGDDPSTDTPVLAVSGKLDHGNLQAHFDQPHR